MTTSEPRAPDEDARECLREAMEAAEVGTWRADLVMGLGIRDAKLNALLGREPMATMGTVEELLDPVLACDRRALAGAVARSRRTGEPYAVDCRVSPGGAEPRWVHLRGRVMRDESGDLVGVAGVAFDVTSRKRHEVEVERELARLASALTGAEEVCRRAVDANRAKDAFLAMIGHELSAPLPTLVTALELARLRGAPFPEQEVLERQASHLAQLVGDLVDVARIAEGKLELRRHPMELHDVVMDGAFASRDILARRRHELVVEVPRRGLRVDVDPGRMAQVVTNLLVNAAKLGEPGSPIHVRAHERGAHAVVLRVSDGRDGLAPSTLAQLFAPGGTEDLTAVRGRGGVALGFAMVKDLVELHGGTVHAESEGPGTAFVLTLPVARASGIYPRGPQTPGVSLLRADDGRAARVLLVDDDGDAAHLLRSALELLGHEVAVAHDAASALATARSFHPDVAFVDIELSSVDGYELAARMRLELHGREGLHLVALTGHAHEDDTKRAADAGFERHLIKPVELERLDTVVRELKAG